MYDLNLKKSKLPKLGSRRKNKPKIEIIPGSLIQKSMTTTTFGETEKTKIRATASVEDLTNSADSSPLVVVKRRKKVNQEMYYPMPNIKIVIIYDHTSRKNINPIMKLLKGQFILQKCGPSRLSYFNPIIQFKAS